MELHSHRIILQQSEKPSYKCDCSGINPQWVSGVIGIHVEATQLHRAPSSGAAATLQRTTICWPLKVQWLVTSFKCNLHAPEIPELNSVDSFPLSLNRAEEQLKRVALKRLVPCLPVGWERPWPGVTMWRMLNGVGFIEETDSVALVGVRYYRCPPHAKLQLYQRPPDG